jgi:hypothetical protein
MDAAELRQLVREVLRDLLPAQPATPPAAATSQAGPVPSGLPAAPPISDPAPSRPTPGGPSDGTVPVRLATDEDLREFVLRVLRLADNPKRRRDLLAGRLRFTLGPGAAASAASAAQAGPAVPTGVPGGNGQRPGPSAAPGPSATPGHSATPDHGATPGHRIGKGAVTERAVQAAADAGVRLVLGPRAVLTPLARDRARALGVPIEKER